MCIYNIRWSFNKKDYFYQIYVPAYAMPMYVCIHLVFSKKGFLPHTSGSLGLRSDLNYRHVSNAICAAPCSKWFDKGLHVEFFN